MHLYRHRRSFIRFEGIYSSFHLAQELFWTLLRLCKERLDLLESFNLCLDLLLPLLLSLNETVGVSDSLPCVHNVRFLILFSDDHLAHEGVQFFPLFYDPLACLCVPLHFYRFHFHHCFSLSAQGCLLSYHHLLDEKLFIYGQWIVSVWQFADLCLFLLLLLLNLIYGILNINTIRGGMVIVTRTTRHCLIVLMGLRWRLRLER